MGCVAATHEREQLGGRVAALQPLHHKGKPVVETGNEVWEVGVAALQPLMAGSS